MTDILFSWIGGTDLNEFKEEKDPTKAPLARAVLQRSFDEIYLASNYKRAETDKYIAWLRATCTTEIHYEQAKLNTPTDYNAIYRFVEKKLTRLSQEHHDLNLTIHLSPGTPQMAAVSILLGKTLFSANTKFLQSSREQGLVDVEVPFNISAEFVPKRFGQALFDRASGAAPKSANFSKIIGDSRQLLDAIEDAAKFSHFNIPVLILGESGTGKELIANAITNSCTDRPPSIYKTVNCGAIAGDLINSELFGHVKGAFTGAIRDKKGIFEAADGGTVFLDEFGELPQETQVRLLRVIQEKKITPIGSTEEILVNVRIIAATNRNLPKDIAEGRFREDLFHRVAVGIVNLPPLRDREGDLFQLTNHFMETICNTYGFKEKKLSPKARNLILDHDWPGNVRELDNALTRASVLSENNVIDERTMARSIIRIPKYSNSGMPETLGKNFDLTQTMGAIEKKYVELALKESKNKKGKAAALLGLPSHQRIAAKIKKYGIED
jgi:transcriptional regulator with PAS, ATPase and Fis domain